MKVQFLGRIPHDPAITSSCDDGKAIAASGDGSKNSAAFIDIAKKIAAL
jgi:septum formation inhibitor-activating ATPase MinD